MTPLFVRGAGAVTAIGADVDATVASLRAGVDAFRVVPHAGRSGVDLQAAPIRGFSEGIGGVARYAALAEQAVGPCADPRSGFDRRAAALLVALPRRDRAGVPDGLADIVRERLSRRADLPLEAVQVFELGRAGFAGALIKARRWLSEARVASCIVGGVDVLTNGDSLRGLSARRLLKEAWDGFIPGEAAAFVHLSSSVGDGPWNASCSRIAGLGAATEPATGTAQDPLTGRAVVTAIRAAMQEANLRDDDIQLHVNDVSGERSAFEDNAMGRIRYFRSPHHSYDVWHVASFVGEIGAASGPLQLVWAAAALDLGFAPGPGVLSTSADGEIRTATVIRAGTSGVGGERRRISVVEPCVHVRPQRTDADDDRGLRLAAEDPRIELARQHLAELAWLWELRRTHVQSRSEPWTGIDGYEHRLLAHLDGLVWLDDRAAAVVGAALDGDEPDQIASALLAALCMPDELGMTDSVVHKARSSQPHLAALMSVLPHAPSLVAAPLLRRLADSPAAHHARAGLHGLAMIGALDRDVVRRQLNSDDTSAALAALRCAGMAGSMDLKSALIGCIDRHAARGVDLTAGALSRVALLASGLGEADLAVLAHDVLVRDAPVAAALACLRDRRPFGPLVEGLPDSPQLLDAIGWAGDVDLIDRLLKAVGSPDPSLAAAAERSLRRLSGLSPVAAGAAKTAAPPLDSLNDPSGAWRDALLADPLPERADRLRHGHAWDRQASLRHLERPECTVDERWIAAWEHAVHSGRGIPVHPERFVAVQREALARATGTVPGSATSPGRR